MPATTAIIAGASALIGTGVSVYEGQQNRNAAIDAANQQTQTQQTLAKQAQDQQTNAQGTEDANAIRDSQKMQYAALADQNAGRGGTILTSPLGVTGTNAANNTSGKTALGA